MANDQKGLTHCHREGGCIRAFDDETCGNEGQCSIILDLAASTPAKPVGELVDLIVQYWDLAYAEGKEGRDHDTPSGDAQRVLSAITTALTTLAAERDALAERLGHYVDMHGVNIRTGRALVLRERAKLTASQAQVATLTAALEPFAELGDVVLSEAPADAVAAWSFAGVNGPHLITLDAFRAARAALNPKAPS